MLVDLRLLLAATLCAVSTLALAAGVAGNADAGAKKAVACMACHGADGNSPAVPAPTGPWPKLAGQAPEYIAKQLQDFKAGRRKNEMMSAQAQNIADVDIPDIAAYFAKQQVKTDAVASKELAAQGEKLFTRGKGRPNSVAACVGCHGFKGVGRGDWAKAYSNPPTVLAPAIGGQHAEYLVKQLTAYKDGSRSNDVAQVMRNIAGHLDAKEIEAVAAYVATLSR